ncbi:MAG: RAMP superfamily CRISPR-associated protein [Bacteroidales bacterium]|nr:RAMP superfamily CRISPR-associated protein [Bacteroidales bacterium]
MNATLFTIDCLTNMHVGSGADNDGLIDNLIQRDAVTDLPTINASSLKGALRDHCKGLRNLNRLFGDENQASAYRFLDAQLIAVPRPTAKAPYELVHSKRQIDYIDQLCDALGYIHPELGDVGEKISDKELATACDDEHLPIMARNQIKEDGTTGNLWYEQVLPRFSRLAFFVLHEGEIDREFEKALTDGLVQIGANATIGCGFCRLTRIPLTRKPQKS